MLLVKMSVPKFVLKFLKLFLISQIRKKVLKEKIYSISQNDLAKKTLNSCYRKLGAYFDLNESL